MGCLKFLLAAHDGIIDLRLAVYGFNSSEARKNRILDPRMFSLLQVMNEKLPADREGSGGWCESITLTARFSWPGLIPGRARISIAANAPCTRRKGRKRGHTRFLISKVNLSVGNQPFTSRRPARAIHIPHTH